MSDEFKFNKQIKVAVIAFAVIEFVVIVAILVYHTRS